jgi:hypothetical protein
MSSDVTPPDATEIENRKEAAKTYVEQTKLLVTLSSGFILAPPVALGFLKDDKLPTLLGSQLNLLLWAEGLFVASVLFGYLTLGSVAGSQDEGTFDIYRKATMILSWCQILGYLGGLALFAYLIHGVLGA